MPATVDKMADRLRTLNNDEPYLVFKRQFNVEQLDLETVQTKMDAHASSIFQNKNRKNNDKKRRQITQIDLTPVQQNAISPISDQLTELFKAVDDGKAVLSDVSILQSRPGCGQQELHRDFNFEAKPSETLKSYLVIVALQDKTKLVIFTKHKRKELLLNKGDLFIGRGDLIHAGAAYDLMNFRLHWFVDYPKNGRLGNKTYFYNQLTDSITEGDYYAKSRKARMENLNSANAQLERTKQVRTASSVRMSEMNKRSRV